MPAISFDDAFAVPAMSPAEGLHHAGWCMQDHFLAPDLTAQLAAECVSAMRSGQMKGAGVGSGHAPLLQPEIRGDHIQWLEAGRSVACDRYLSSMEALRQQ